MIDEFVMERGGVEYLVFPDNEVITDASHIFMGTLYINSDPEDNRSWRWSINLMEHFSFGEPVSELDIQEKIWKYGCLPKVKEIELQEWGNDKVKLSI